MTVCVVTKSIHVEPARTGHLLDAELSRLDFCHSSKNIVTCGLCLLCSHGHQCHKPGRHSVPDPFPFWPGQATAGGIMCLAEAPEVQEGNVVCSWRSQGLVTSAGILSAEGPVSTTGDPPFSISCSQNSPVSPTPERHPTSVLPCNFPLLKISAAQG